MPPVKEIENFDYGMNESSFTCFANLSADSKLRTPARHNRKTRRCAAHLFAGVLSSAAALHIFGCAHFDRERWQQPARVIEALQIDHGDKIADLGSGDGYFSFRLADATGPEGLVYAIDVDQDVLDELAAAAVERDQTHVRTVLASADSPGLAASSVDLIFVCNTYHHLERRTAYFARLKSILRPGGRVAIIELDDTPWYVPFMSAHETEADTIATEMSRAGFTREAVHEFLDYQNFQVFSLAGVQNPTPATAGAASR